MRKCPKCGKQSEFEDSKYCVYCGTYLINHCSNPYCNMNNGQELELDPNARFCDLCGYPSTFLEEGLLTIE